ncbi:hypothetical protein PSTT_01096, partial [Puccinia striiformis]
MAGTDSLEYVFRPIDLEGFKNWTSNFQFTNASLYPLQQVVRRKGFLTSVCPCKMSWSSYLAGLLLVFRFCFSCSATDDFSHQWPPKLIDFLGPFETFQMQASHSMVPQVTSTLASPSHETKNSQARSIFSLTPGSTADNAPYAQHTDDAQAVVETKPDEGNHSVAVITEVLEPVGTSEGNHGNRNLAQISSSSHSAPMETHKGSRFLNYRRIGSYRQPRCPHPTPFQSRETSPTDAVMRQKPPTMYDSKYSELSNHLRLLNKDEGSSGTLLGYNSPKKRRKTAWSQIEKLDSGRHITHHGPSNEYEQESLPMIEMNSSRDLLPEPQMHYSPSTVKWPINYIINEVVESETPMMVQYNSFQATDMTPSSSFPSEAIHDHEMISSTHVNNATPQKRPEIMLGPYQFKSTIQKQPSSQPISHGLPFDQWQDKMVSRSVNIPPGFKVSPQSHIGNRIYLDESGVYHPNIDTHIAPDFLLSDWDKSLNRLIFHDAVFKVENPSDRDKFIINEIISMIHEEGNQMLLINEDLPQEAYDKFLSLHQISLLNQGEPINANSDSIKNAAEQFPTILQSVNLRFKSKSDAIYESDPSDHMEASSSQYENRKRAKFYKGETPETLWKILENLDSTEMVTHD